MAAARAGAGAAPHHSVAIQLSAQEAKARARTGERRQAEVALDKGRRLLEAMPYPDNLDHHFVVDPTKPVATLQGKRSVEPSPASE